MNKFEELGIHDIVLKNIEEKGITTPTPIQSRAIPLIMRGEDVLGESSTGSGKTLAFGAGVLDNLKDGKKGYIASLILTPTREIAQQVRDVLIEFSKGMHLQITPIYGGVSIMPQIKQLKTADIVIATPGRLLDHVERGTIDLSNVEMVVLDEADKMFEMGFIDDVKEILSICPSDIQTLLFSATFSTQIKQIATRYMNNPKKVKGEAAVDPAKLKQCYMQVPVNMKFSLLVSLLKNNDIGGLTLVFANTKRMVDTLVRSLKINGIDAIAIHGGLTQAKRARSLQDLKDFRKSILICTDVAARGLDIPHVSHVYNYDIPDDPNDYVHRSGRTARAGKDGMVINLLCSNDYDNFSRVMRENPRLNIPQEETPHLERCEMAKAERRGRGGPRRGGNNAFGKFSGRRSGASGSGARTGRGGSRGGNREGGRSGGSSEGSRREGGSRSGPRRDGPRRSDSGRSNPSLGSRGGSRFGGRRD